MSLLGTILNIFFPEKCLSCGKSGAGLCLKCLSSSPEAERESAEWIFPLFDYRHPPIKKSIWLLKYKNKKNLATIFAEAMYPRILEEASDRALMENFTNPVLIPIPLARSRLRERGFNQAELIAKKIISLDADGNFKLMTDVLIKPKDTKHQAHIENRSERLKNIVGSFAVEYPEKIQKANIILIDDVSTTGATLNEAKKILKQAGARKIIAFTIAH